MNYSAQFFDAVFEYGTVPFSSSADNWEFISNVFPHMTSDFISMEFQISVKDWVFKHLILYLNQKISPL